MADILVVTADGGGNVRVILGVAGELIRRGHGVHVLFRPLVPGMAIPADVLLRVASAGAMPIELPPEVWDVPVARPAVEAPEACAEFTPVRMVARSAPLFVPIATVVARVLASRRWDAVIVDGHHAAAVAAEAAGVPAVLHVPNISFSRVLDGLPVPGRGTLLSAADPVEERAARERFVAGVDTVALDHLNDARLLLGLEPMSTYAVQERAELQLVAASPAFDLVPSPIPSNLRWIGLVRDHGPVAEWRSPWPDNDCRPLVVMSPTTTFMATQQLPFVRAAIDAMARLDVRGLVTLGPSLDRAAITGDSGPVVVSGPVPHDSVVPSAAAVVTHAGHGTTMTALRHGVPVICSPQFGDQPDVAARVVERGLGVRVSHPPSVDELVDAISTVLDEPLYAERAAQLATILATEDGAATAADHIEQLLARHR